MDCIPCFVRQAAEAVSMCIADESRRTEIMRCILSDIAQSDWNASPAAVARGIQRRIHLETGHPDPYRSFKQSMNRLALEMLPAFHQEARLDEDPQMAIVRMALAGNLIDAGAKTGLSEMEARRALCRACRARINGSAKTLFKAAEQARQILFLADNAGEIVFDRVLIEALPVDKITVGVRGSPVLNDATMEDAEVAGLPDIVKVIPNGSDAPGTIIEDCSNEFRRVFETSDLIIAKGQGNYESLNASSKHIFFLLLVKCHRVAADIEAPVGEMIVCERNGIPVGEEDAATMQKLVNK